MAASIHYHHLILPHFQDTVKSDFSERHLRQWTGSPTGLLDTRASLGESLYIRCRFNFRDCQVLVADTAEQVTYREDHVGIAWVSENAARDKSGYLTTLLNPNLQNGAYDYYPSKQYGPRKFVFARKHKDEAKNFEEIQSVYAASSSGVLGTLPPHIKDLIIQYLYDDSFLRSRPTILTKRTQNARDRLRWNTGLETGAIDAELHHRVLTANKDVQLVNYEPIYSLASNLSSTCRMLNCDVKSHWLKSNVFLFKKPEQLHRFVDSMLPGLTLLERWPHTVIRHIVIDLSENMKNIRLGRGTIVAPLSDEGQSMPLHDHPHVTAQEAQSSTACVRNLCSDRHIDWRRQLEGPILPATRKAASTAAAVALPTNQGLNQGAGVHLTFNIAQPAQVSTNNPNPALQPMPLSPNAATFIPTAHFHQNHLQQMMHQYLSTNPTNIHAFQQFLTTMQAAGSVPQLQTVIPGLSGLQAHADSNVSSSTSPRHVSSIGQPPTLYRPSDDTQCPRTLWLHDVQSIMRHARSNTKRWKNSHTLPRNYGIDAPPAPKRKEVLNDISSDGEEVSVEISDENVDDQATSTFLRTRHSARRIQLAATHRTQLPVPPQHPPARDLVQPAVNAEKFKAEQTKDWAVAIDYLLDTFPTRRLDVVFDTEIVDKDIAQAVSDGEQPVEQRNIAMFEDVGRGTDKDGNFRRARLLELVRECISGGRNESTSAR